MKQIISPFTRILISAAFVTLVAAPISAADLESNVSFVVVEQTEAGEERLVERSTVKPGEVIEYRLRHENTTKSGMDGLVISAPIPGGVTYTSGSDTSSVPALFEVLAELDPEQEGLEWSTLPATRLVKSGDGTLREEPLPLEDIKAVRWSLSEELPAGELALNGYRVRLN